VLKEDGVCDWCTKKIGVYPFYYNPRSRELFHYYCFSNENIVIKDEEGTPKKKEFKTPTK